MNKPPQQWQAATTSQSVPQLADIFSDAQQQALVALRVAYQQSHDLLSVREQSHLRFLRWLIETGRLVP